VFICLIASPRLFDAAAKELSLGLLRDISANRSIRGRTCSITLDLPAPQSPIRVMASGGRVSDVAIRPARISTSASTPIGSVAVGSRAAPALIDATDAGVTASAVFTTDPISGYPPGTPDALTRPPARLFVVTGRSLVGNALPHLHSGGTRTPLSPRLAGRDAAELGQSRLQPTSEQHNGSVTELVLVLCGAVVKTAFALWIGDNTFAENLSSDLTDLIKDRVGSALDRRKVRARFDKMEEIVADQILSMLNTEFRSLDEGERNAAVLAVTETLNLAQLTDKVLFAGNLDPFYLNRFVRTFSAQSTRDLSWGGVELYDRVLAQCCAYIIEIADKLPRFQAGVCQSRV
jgi:hypothetical protein